jgi:hypothetical protein
LACSVTEVIRAVLQAACKPASMSLELFPNDPAADEFKAVIFGCS